LGTDAHIVKGFERVQQIYAMEVYASKLGLLRPFIAYATRNLAHSTFASVSVPWSVILASLQSTRTLEAVRDETMLMMDFGRDVAAAWGPLSFHRLPTSMQTRLETLSGSEVVPGGAESGSFALERQRIKAELRAMDDGGLALPRRWRDIAVCSVSCRNYWYDPHEWFMTAKVKNMYAAEHNFVSLLARCGRRIEYVHESHMTGPFLGAELLDAAEQLLVQTP